MCSLLAVKISATEVIAGIDTGLGKNNSKSPGFRMVIFDFMVGSPFRQVFVIVCYLFYLSKS